MHKKNFSALALCVYQIIIKSKKYENDSMQIVAKEYNRKLHSFVYK